MTDLTIAGINPLVISGIRWRKAYRRGYHPAYTKYMKKKNPIRGILGLYSQVPFDGFNNAEVRIFGADGSLLRYQLFNSNDGAKRACEEYTAQLQEFLQRIQLK